MIENNTAYLINRFSMYFPEIAKNLAECEIDPFHPNELIIWLDDGGRFLYDDISNCIRQLPRDVTSMSKNETLDEFGRRLEKIMYRKHITQSELSERTGLSQPTISNCINGKYNPGLYTLDKIAKALGCSLDEFRCL